VRHRLEVCGLERPLPFDRAALKRVHAASGGVPRRINLLCDRALLGAYANGQGQVTRRIVDQAAAEVFPRASRPSARSWPRVALAGALGLAAGAGLLAAATRVGEPAQPPMAAVIVPRPEPAEVVPPPEPPAPAAVPVQVAAVVPAKPTLLRDEKEAWRELAQAWKLEVPVGDPCAALARERVLCLSRNLSLALIRQLGRPGIVTLDAQTGRPSYAILSALTEQTATLRAAGTEQTVTLAALAERWQGDFATLWRAPEGYRDNPRDGHGGPGITWVAARLASAKGAPPPDGEAKLDARLRAELRAFQVAQGLPVDGRLGPLTYMQLNRATGVDEPRLRTEP
jgi:general secretion pathway protein A